MLSNSKGLSTILRSAPYQYIPGHIGTPNLTAQYYNATINSQSTDVRAATAPTDSKSSYRSKGGDDDENKGRKSLETILLKREAARIKYQQLLLKRTSSFQSSSNQVIEMSKSSRDDYNDLSRMDTDRSSIRSLDNESRDEDDMCLQENHDSNNSSHVGDSSQEKILVPFHPKIRSDFVRNHSMAYNKLVTTVFRAITKRNMNSSAIDFHRHDNKIKSGLLKSMSFMNIGEWVEKTVELSPGILTYYEDIGDVQTCVRSKSINLFASICECNITNIKQREKALFPKEGAIFEIKTSNSPIQYWMASSYQEMEDWVNAIKFAILTTSLASEEDENCVNDQVKKSGTIDRNIPSVLERYNADVVCFLHVRDLCIQATSEGEYKDALSLIQGKTLRIPSKWLRRYMLPSFHPEKEHDTKKLIGSTSMDKVWKDMETEEVIINGKLIRGDSMHGVERIISTMTSYIRDMDRFGAKLSSAEKPVLKESQAVYFTRDIMSSCNRKSSGAQSRFCVERLCANKSLAYVAQSPSDAEPIEFFLNPCQIKNNVTENERYEHGLPLGRGSGFSFAKRPSTAPVKSSRKIDFQNKKRHAMRSDDLSSPSTPTVEISARVSNIYRICRVDRIKCHTEQTWGLMRTHFLQKFWIGGVPQAELIDDDEIVEITFAI